MAYRLTRPFRRGTPPAGEPSVDAEPDATSPGDRAIIERARPYTMTSDPRLQALIDAVRYSVVRGVPGAFVECGVWRGGSVVAMLLTLLELESADRDVYLFDTFEGMTLPTEHDVAPDDESALATWRAAEATGEQPWAEAFGPEMFGEDQVREVVLSTGYPPERLHLVRGPVEQTLPGRAPDAIALLRLDTDWYESTKHELLHLYPRLSQAGVLLIDDYGHWKGAKLAVDEYFAGTAAPMLLNRIDYTGRVGIKA